MPRHFSSAWSHLVRWHGEHNSVLEQALLENLARLPWVLGALLPLFGVGLWLSWGNSAQDDPSGMLFTRVVGWLDLGMVVWLSVLLVLFRFKNLRHRVTPLGRVLPLILAINFVSFGAALSIMSQWMLPSATMYVLCCVFVGTLLLIRPTWMAWVYGGSYAVFYTVLGLSGATWPALQVLRFHGAIAACLGMCLSVLLWRRHTVTELLRRRVAAQSQALQTQNADLARQQKLLEKLAQHDALTGLLNRRAFEVQADQALMRVQRDGSKLCALMLDLDFFKRVNDKHGHLAGDAVIRFMATVLQDGVRATDLVARVGGEEFMVLLPGTSVVAAAELAEKIRRKVQDTPVFVMPDLAVHMTVSIGVAEMAAGQAVLFKSLYLAADQALYQAKRQGRNRVELHNVHAAESQ